MRALSRCKWPAHAAAGLDGRLAATGIRRGVTGRFRKFAVAFLHDLTDFIGFHDVFSFKLLLSQKPQLSEVNPLDTHATRATQGERSAQQIGDHTVCADNQPLGNGSLLPGGMASCFIVPCAARCIEA